MSRDRLAERRRAQQQQQQQPGNTTRADPLSYNDDNYDDAGPPSGYSAYGSRQSSGARRRQDPYSDMDYTNEYAQASNPSLHGAPPPSYKSRHDEDDVSPREQSSRRRRPSESRGGGNNPGPSRQRSRSGSQGAASSSDRRGPQRQQTHDPMPSSSGGRRRQADPYGSREDQNAYHENNQSSAALNTRSQQQQSYGNFDQQPPSSRSRKGSSNNEQADVYEIPTLSKGSSRQQPNRQPSYNSYGPQSPPYSAVAPGSAGPSAGMNGAGGAHVTSNAPDIDMNAFFEELDSVRDQIKEMEKFITYLDQLHSRNLSGTGGDQAVEELQNASAEMRQMSNSLRIRVKDLQETTRIRTHGQAEQDRLVRKTQIEGLRNRFMEVLQTYQSMEMKHRDKSRQRIERQYLIAKPDASPEEIRKAVEGGQEVQVFAQALRQSNRVGNAQGVLNEVQNRHEDIKQIERTLVELFQMFQDMAQLVDEQDEQIIMIEQKAEETAKDVEAGHTEIVQAKVSAKKARKKRKCCCIISLILLLIIGGVVAYLVVKVILPKINENKDNNDDNKEKETKTVTQSAGTRTQQAAVNTNTAANANTNVNTGTAVNVGSATRLSTPSSTALRVRDLLAFPGRSSDSEEPEVTARGYMLKL